MYKLLLAIALFAASVSPTTAQKGATVPINRQYATQLRLRAVQATTPGLADAMSASERFTEAFRRTGSLEPVTVALVFHLMPLPDGAAITTADIQAQLARLNVDFFNPEHPYLAESYQHPALRYDSLDQVVGTVADLQPYLHESDRLEGFAQHAALPQIQFCLAAQDPNGQATGGVLQPAVAARAWPVGDTLCSAAFGGSNPWLPARYCNVWVARLADNYAGYAQMPGGPDATDGVVIDDRFFARAHPDTTNPFYLGRTLTHLLGSYLNLYELWNDDNPCSDDYVDDTPIHSSANDGIALYKHISLCSEDNIVEMTSNLMDNTDDAGQYLFTRGQVLRMQAALAEGGPRGALRFSPVVCSPGFSGPGGDERSAQSNPDALNNGLQLRVFPNPAAGQFTIEIYAELPTDADWQVLNPLGQIVFQQSERAISGTLRRQIETADWSPGLYLLQLVSGGKKATRMVLIER